MEKRQLKPWMAVIFVLAYAVDIFILGGIFAQWFGVWGTVCHEVVLVLLAVGFAVAFRADLREVFPFQKPKLSTTLGTIILWIGSYLGIMMITMFITYFFPKEVMEAGQGVQQILVGLPALASLLLVSLTPAICEEVAFRGAFLGCFRGGKHKWVGIIIVAVVFGMFHGSIWRMIPTMLLGIMMGYLLVETGNMFYNMLFHLINNAFPILLLALMQLILPATQMNAALDTAAVETLPLASVGAYLLYGAAAPILIYIGNHLIHRGQPGFDRGIFPREKRTQQIVLIVVSLLMAGAGMLVMIASVLSAAFAI